MIVPYLRKYLLALQFDCLVLSSVPVEMLRFLRTISFSRLTDEIVDMLILTDEGYRAFSRFVKDQDLVALATVLEEEAPELDELEAETWDLYLFFTNQREICGAPIPSRECRGRTSGAPTSA